jgi:isopentenyl phosphate kinase
MHLMATMSNMPRVIVKLGGGLITDKSLYRQVRLDRIDAVSAVIKELKDSGYSVIIVHGAGSFGHLEARKWKISEGYNRDISKEQANAVTRIRSDMDDLNEYVVKSLMNAGVECEVMPPRKWATGVGVEFQGDLDSFVRDPALPVPITFGDVVDTADDARFGILSGDHIMVRLGCEVPDVSACIFLLGDVDGLMDRPPNEAGAMLLERWKLDEGLSESHNPDVDVTGGIMLKARCASLISRRVEDVWLLNGTVPNRMLNVVSNGDTIGTRVLH